MSKKRSMVIDFEVGEDTPVEHWPGTAVAGRDFSEMLAAMLNEGFTGNLIEPSDPGHTYTITVEVPAESSDYIQQLASLLPKHLLLTDALSDRVLWAALLARDDHFQDASAGQSEV